MILFRKVVRLLALLLLLTLLASIATWLYLNPQPHRQQLFINGSILTMDANNTIAEAMLTSGKRVMATGRRDELEKLASIDAVEVDLEGRTVVPGFIEAHGHFPASGLDAIAADLRNPPAGTVNTLDELLQKLKDQVEETNAEDWIIGTGYDDTLLRTDKPLTREELDTVSDKRPVFVRHISGHMAVVNSAGLKLLGIKSTSSSPFGGEIEKDSDGHPTGIIKGTALRPIIGKVFNLSYRRLVKALANSVEDYIVEGVTSVQNGLTRPPLYFPLAIMSATGFIPQRITFWPEEKLADQIENKHLFPDGAKVKTGAVKLVTDGAIQLYTAYLSTPYQTIPVGKATGLRGALNFHEIELVRKVRKWHNKGWQLAFHANGDAAIDQVLNAVELAQKKNYREDHRHILVHSQVIRSGQLDRLKQLGMTVSFFPAHIFYWGDRHRRLFLGEKRASRINPLKTALDKGIRFTIHSDSPVTPVDSMGLINSAVIRQTRSNYVLGKEERISVLQALRAVTIDAAWQVFRDDEIGSLEPGKLADFAILSQNPLNNSLSESEQLTDIKVEETWIGGVKRYDRYDFPVEP